MSGFDDLLDPLFTPPTYDSSEPHVVGTTLNILTTILDGDENEINLTSGFTAACTPTVKRNTPVATWTNTLTSGRQVLLGNGTVALKATPAASAGLFTPYIGQVAVMTLIITRTSDGASAAVWRECYLPLLRKLNP